jgi:hypothetical protein
MPANDDIYDHGPWNRISGLRLARLSYPLIPYSCWHFMRQPYRRKYGILPLPRNFGTRTRVAAYDAVMTLLIGGFARLTQLRPHPSSGALVILFNRLVGAFDDELERRVNSNLPLQFDEVLMAQAVGDRVDALSEFLTLFSLQSDIRGFLRERVTAQYDRYLGIIRSEPCDLDLDSYIEAATIDSAGFAACIAQVLCLFHDVPANDRLVDEFAAFGMVAKHVDDFVDFWPDSQQHRINLLDGFIRQYPEELARISLSSGAPVKAGIGWWAAACPCAVRDFSAALDEHLRRLTTPELRKAAEIALVPALRGWQVVKPESLSIRS